MKAVNGDSVQYTWLLKIKSDFSVNKTFCHFFQLKPVGTNDEYPIATLSGAVTNGDPQLEFRTFGENEKTVPDCRLARMSQQMAYLYMYSRIFRKGEDYFLGQINQWFHRFLPLH